VAFSGRSENILSTFCEKASGTMTITIKAARDAEAGIWYIADSDLPGLNLEGESLDELYDKLFHGIEELTGEPKVEFELVVIGRRWPALV
jgi:predicted RNase H-like HicB family nuclease